MEFLILLVLLPSALMGFFFLSPKTEAKAEISEFSRFKRTYIAAYLLAQLCDYLQGPYRFAVYSELHRLSVEQVGLLFLTGSAANAFSGCILGPLTDSNEKSLGCIAFCLVSILACWVIRSSLGFEGLLIGRVLGGTASNLLETSFEAFVVCEHYKRGFLHEQLEYLFVTASGGAGFVAIAAGILSSFAASCYGITAPFLLAELVGVICLAYILFLWMNKSKGPTRQDIQYDTRNPGRRISATAICAAKDAVHLFATRRDIQLYGILQATFEIPLELFVCLWTQGLNESLNHGVAFACLMAGVACGSHLFSFASSRVGIELPRLLAVGYLGGAVAMLCAAFVEQGNLRFAAYISFEVACGFIQPALSSLRAKLLPDSCRASVTNLPRVLLNITLLGVLGFQALRHQALIFGISSLCLVITGATTALIGNRFFSRHELLHNGHGTTKLEVPVNHSQTK